ncbi:MAG TPA: fumarylacetoacetate hydrolase family protein [Lacunisphaera sp.]|nr:fumarylacetoacetate hydrolase family protein [Lacunisphaera sp.]
MPTFELITQLAPFLAAGGLLGSMGSRGDEPVFCRVARAEGDGAYGRLQGVGIRLLDAAPWLGGRETGVVVPLAGARLLPPSEPRNILCLANAYVGKEKTPPKFIRWFAKTPGSVATDGDTIEIPAIVDQLKAEVEVVIVVGRRLKNATEAEAEAGIFGYTTGNEIFGFAESFQKVNQEAAGRTEVMLAAGLKLGDKFTPFGPFIHGGSGWLHRTCALTVTNAATGKRLEYRGDTRGFLYTPARVLRDLSRVLTLEPGDLIFTGTERALVLDPGDEVTAEIEGLGRLNNRIAAAAKPG